MNTSQLTSRKLSAFVIKALYAKKETNKKIAEILGVEPPFVSNASKGEKKLSVDHLLKLADGYGQSLPKFLEEHLPDAKVSANDDAKTINKNVRESLDLVDKATKLLSGIQEKQ